MGMNFHSCCHKCQVLIFHFRGKENEKMQKFYRKHYDCIKNNPDNVETKSDYGQEEDWMDEYNEDRLI